MTESRPALEVTDRSPAARHVELEPCLDLPAADFDREARVLFAACLETPSRLLDQLEAVESATSYPWRQRMMLALILAALDTAIPERSELREYVRYHRDWLVRYPVLTSGQGQRKAQEILDLLEGQSDRMGPPNLDGLNRATRGVLPDELAAEWRDRAHRLAEHCQRLEGIPEHGLDPFTRHPVFPVLLRLFHAVARKVGLALLDEAVLHHLILRASGAGDGRAGFCLAPHFEGVPEIGSEAPGELSSSFEEGYSWPDVVALSGDEAQAWVKRYFRSRRETGEGLQEALRLLRGGEIERGGVLLDQVERYRQDLLDSDEALFHLLGRFYHGENAYYRYRLDDLQGAYREMDEAGESVRRAIETRRFLLPVAPLVVDIPLQKARVARRERNWPAMERYLKTMYEMEAGLKPLCVLADGTEVDYPLLEEHFENLAIQGEGQEKLLAILDSKTRLKEYRRLTTKLYALPNLITVS